MFNFHSPLKFSLILIFLVFGSITLNAQNNLGEDQSNQRDFPEIQNYKRLKKMPLVDENEIVFNFIKDNYSDLIQFEKDRIQIISRPSLKSNSVKVQLKVLDKEIDIFARSRGFYESWIVQSIAYKKFRNSSQQSLKYLYENESRLKENKLKNQ